MISPPRDLLFPVEETEGDWIYRRGELRGVDRGEAVVKTYCMKQEPIFNKKCLPKNEEK